MKKEEDPDDFPPALIKEDERGRWMLAVKVPTAYDGLTAGDTVGMLLGGSGDMLAYALSRRGEQISARVFRVPPHVFQKLHEITGQDKNEATFLAELVQIDPQHFYPVKARDRDLIILRHLLRLRTEAMQARIGCEQRLSQHVIGLVFCNPDSLYPEGALSKALEGQRANGAILQALTQEEIERERALIRCVEGLNVYRRLFAPITGCGPLIAARLIAAIGDIRRFPTAAAIKAFCGVHVVDSKLPRRRHGQVANWHPDARQALYLLADQFNRRPDSDWGIALRRVKAQLRVAHPEAIEEDGKSKYSDGHIHKMAIWRTLTKFTEWLFEEWWRLEREQETKAVAA